MTVHRRGAEALRNTRRVILLAAVGVAWAAAGEVREGGVTLRYSDYSSHKLERVEKRVAVPDDGPELYAPAHVVAHLLGRPGEASVAVIPVGDAKSYPGIAAAARALRSAGKRVPGRKALQAMDALCTDARQGFVTRTEYVEGAGVAGFGFLTQYTQEELPDPANSRDLTYVFVGLTKDGRHFVEASFSVGHPALPRDPQATEGRARVRAEEAKLAGFQEGTFTPSLTSLKELVRSIEVAQ